MSVPMRRVVREWPANEAGRRAAERALARGQLVHAERHGDVVRVVLQLPTPTAPRQHPATYPDKVGTGPRQGWHVPAAVFGAVVGAAVACVALSWWVVLWVAGHLALVIGWTALLLGAPMVVWFLLGRAGMCPGVHCPGCRCS